MKKSLMNMGFFVLLVALSVFLPAYVLLTGSATFMPLVTAGVVISAVAGIGTFAFTLLSVYLAEKRQNVASHKDLVKLRDYTAKLPLWRKLSVLVRYAIQAVLMLALGSPLSAGFVFASLIGVFLASGMIDSYFARLPNLNRYNTKTANYADGKLHVGVGEGLQSEDFTTKDLEGKAGKGCRLGKHGGIEPNG